MSEQRNTHVVGLSGGKDSCALALRAKEVWPEREWLYFCSPTGDELPEMVEHWDRLECLLGQEIVKVSNGTLDSWIEHYKMIPNFRSRWCTRVLKIEPCLSFLRQLDNPILYVGLRHDEPTREGIYTTEFPCRFPLREWGWDIKDVRSYLRAKGVKIPPRTDCARCYGQRLSEWYNLRRDYPDLWALAVENERWVSEVRGADCTFRSPQRDTWPAGLVDLGAEFERRIPRGATNQIPMFDTEPEEYGCRVCRL